MWSLVVIEMVSDASYPVLVFLLLAPGVAGRYTGSKEEDPAPSYLYLFHVSRIENE
jgi:hypothetical protein